MSLPGTALTPVFALGFVNVAMLGGLAAASIPILLHLLNRRKFRERRWAAMRFLLAAIKKNQRRIRLEQLLLLAVRTLLILLVVLAMARPFLESYQPIALGQRSHRVLVLDGSLSMGYTTADTSRFEQAKSLAQRMVKDSRRGDAISVVLMGDPPKVVVPGPSANLGEVSKEIAEIAQTHGTVDLTATFEAVDRVLAASDIPQKEVVFLSDLQASSWRKGRGADDGLRRAAAKLTARDARSIVIDVGATGGPNRAITDLALNLPVVTVGGPSPVVTATLKNFGREPAPGVRVRLVVDGQVTDEQQVSLEPGEDRAVAFVTAFAAAGDHLVEVLIDDDPLPIDNHRWLAVPVRERLKALLVDGDPRPETFGAETDYLTQAIDPIEDSGTAPSVIQAEVAGESQLRNRELTGYDVIVLANVAQFTAEEARLLDSYLQQGGGLVVFAGDRVAAENYNRLLYNGGKGFLPAEIGATVGDAQKPTESSFGLDPLDFAHPIVAEYKGAAENVAAGLTGVKAWQYLKLTPAKGTTAEVALAFETGDPAVLEMPYGRGRVYLIATAADAGWSDWPLHPSYPPVMEQILLRAAAGKLDERNTRVGRPLDLAFGASGAGAPLTVVTPSQKAVPGKLAADGDVSRLHFEETDLSGPYRAKIGPPVAIDALFAADPDPAESAPEKLDEPALAAAVPGWKFLYYSDWRGLLQATTSISRHGELHRPLLYAVIALLLIETLLAWRFGHHR